MTKTRKCNYHKYIDSYMDDIRSEKILSSKELKQAMDYIEFKLTQPNVIIKTDMIDKAVELIEKYFNFKLLNWELFLIALIHAYYKDTDMVVFDKVLLVMGRGNGKNGFISPVAWYLTTHYHGINEYNVDIIANNEEQAKTSFNDVYNMLVRTWNKSKKFFKKTKEEILNLKTMSYIKFNTSNAKTKDGKRSACLIFDEIHEYEVYDTINVFTSGFGKRKNSRAFYITTNGYVRDGVLDKELAVAERVLNGEIKELGLLPLIYKIDSKEEYTDPRNWVKANPSLPYFPELKAEMDKNFITMKFDSAVALDFMTKRMNCPAQDYFEVVAPWEKILATNKPIPYEEMKGLKCIGAIDYAEIYDFASVGLLFKHNGKRIYMEHTFVCHLALQVESRKINFPVDEMVERGLITIVYDDLIDPELIADWFIEKAKLYNIVDIVADDFRVSILRSVFKRRGLPLSKVRTGYITHSKLVPLVDTIFAKELLVLGDNPTMRWYINNVYKKVIDGRGNIAYEKIEPKTRKTDGFFGLLHALSKDDLIQEQQRRLLRLDVHTY